ncbi:MAG: tyrosine-type recombinase/integrase [Saprospiraceae bacterium]|nr:tyrosine-type recombinase/integrase [Saprospiraceae bacterium]
MHFGELIGRFLAYLEAERKYSPHTILSYQNDLNQLHTFIIHEFSIQTLEELSHSHIRSWMVHMMQEGVTAVSVNRKISALRSAFRWFKKKGFILQNPMLKITVPKKPKRLPVVVQKNSLERLLDDRISPNEEDMYIHARNSMIIDLFYATGIRRSELKQLTTGDIDFFRKEIRVVGKGNKVRSIPITQPILDKLDQYLKIRNDNFPGIPEKCLFLTPKAKPVYDRMIYDIVHRELSQVNTAGKKSPHVLRHTFATHMLDNGADLNAIKEILGHASLAATQVYTHNSLSKLKEAYGKAHPRAGRTNGT